MQLSDAKDQCFVQITLLDICIEKAPFDECYESICYCIYYEFIWNGRKVKRFYKVVFFQLPSNSISESLYGTIQKNGGSNAIYVLENLYFR